MITILAIVGLAHADTVTVCAVGCDYELPSEAFGDVDATRIEISAGTYIESAGIDVENDVTVVGDGSGVVTITTSSGDLLDIQEAVTTFRMTGVRLDPATNRRALEFDGETTATLTDVLVDGHTADDEGGVIWVGASEVTATALVLRNISGSQDGAGLYVEGGTLTLTDSTFEGLESDGDGAAVYSDGGDIVIDGSTFSGGSALGSGGAISVIDATLSFLGAASSLDGNTAAVRGGALALAGANLEATGTTFSLNSADDGGAVWLDGASAADLSLAAFTTCDAGSGGAVRVEAGGELTAIDVDMDGNSAKEGGGAVWAGVDASLTWIRGTATDNVADVDGGAFHLATPDATFDGTELSGNSAPDGGAVWSNLGTVTIDDAVFDGNAATAGEGGHIYANFTDLTLDGGDYSTGSATLRGGALYAAGGDVIVDEVAFLANLANGAGADGGAIAALSGTLTATGSLFDANEALGDGGAVWADGAIVDVDGCIFSGNAASATGGGIGVFATDLTAANTSFVGNEAVQHGGAINHDKGGDLIVSTSDIWRNEANAVGGGIRTAETSATQITFVSFCENTADDGAAASQGVASVAGDHLWSNNVFHNNTAVDDGVFRLSGTTAIVVHNDFLDGSATDGGGTWASTTTGIFQNNLVAWQTAGGGLEASASPALAVDYDLWWENVPVDADVALGAHAVLADPLLSDWTPGVACEDIDTMPAGDSPLLNAGDPASPNPDGTPGHIGSWGGPLADPVLFVDSDDDGSTDAWDCADLNPDLSPLHPELCNGVDDDCDGRIDGLDDDLDPSDSIAIYEDDDNDDFGGAYLGQACTVPAGTTETPGDCDDDHDTVYPGAQEVCGGLDDDCDTLVDGNDPSIDLDTAVLWYDDLDDDGVGGPNGTLMCTGPDGTSTATGDCDDDDPARFPGNAEACNGIDDDCDDLIDDADPVLDDPSVPQWPLDVDDDGYGGPDGTLPGCAPPLGAAALGGDCDDLDSDVHPDQLDAPCNGVDDDCDTLIDEDPGGLTWYVDGDDDGFGAEAVEGGCEPPEGTAVSGGDCDDANASAYPGATEVAADGIDQDCNGSDLGGTPGTTTPPATEDGRPLPDPTGTLEPEEPVVDLGCGCDQAPSPSGLAWLALVALRRRSRGLGRG